MADGFGEWYKNFETRLEYVAYPKYWLQLSRMDPKDENSAAHPQHARDSTEKLKAASTEIDLVTGGLLHVLIELPGHWEGPAADLFGKTIDAFARYTTELSAGFSVFAKATQKVTAAHQTAWTDMYDLDTEIHDYWYGNAAKDKVGVSSKYSTAKPSYVLAYSSIPDEGTDAAVVLIRELETSFDIAHDQYVARAKVIVDALSVKYQNVWPEYIPLPTLDLSRVVVKSDKLDDTKKDPDSDPDPDLSKTLKDLLGGGGGGGGGPDLGGSGGGLDLGGLGGGSGGGLGGGLGGSELPGFNPGAYVPGPGGSGGYDVTGNGRPDLMPNGSRTPNSDLPAGARTVRRPDGSYGLDLNGDGVADVGLDGKALPDGNAPQGARLVTGPDGTTGYDITGNDVPDLGLDLQPLPTGDLPDGSALAPTSDGTSGLDLNGDGVADATMGGRGLPGAGAGNGGQLATGPDGTTGFDMTGDGVPDIGFDGRPLTVAPPTPDPGGVVPNDQVRYTTEQVGGGGSQVATQDQLGMGGGYPPPIPPPVGGAGMGGGGQGGDRDRNTWLQEDDEVWAEDLMPVSALGRPVDDGADNDDEQVDEWAVPARRPRGVPRPGRSGPAGWPSDRATR